MYFKQITSPKVVRAYKLALATLLLALTFMPLQVMRGSSDAINLYQLGSFEPYVFLTPVFFLLALLSVAILELRREGVYPLSILAGWAIFASAAMTTDINAEISEPYGTILIIAFCLTVSTLLFMSILKIRKIIEWKAGKLIARKTASLRENAKFIKISPLKLGILSFSTFGLYDIYWLRKNMLAMQATSHELKSTSELFIYFYPKKLLSRVGVARAGTMATLYTILWFSPFFLPYGWFILSYFTFLPLLPAQKLINITSPLEPASRNLSRKEWLLVILSLSFNAIIWIYVPAIR